MGGGCIYCTKVETIPQPSKMFLGLRYLTFLKEKFSLIHAIILLAIRNDCTFTTCKECSTECSLSLYQNMTICKRHVVTCRFPEIGHDLKELIKKRILVLDGAMGTMIQVNTRNVYFENPWASFHGPFYSARFFLKCVHAAYYTLYFLCNLRNTHWTRQISGAKSSKSGRFP